MCRTTAPRPAGPERRREATSPEVVGRNDSWETFLADRIATSARILLDARTTPASALRTAAATIRNCLDMLAELRTHRAEADAPSWCARLALDARVSEAWPVVRGTTITAGWVASRIVDGCSWAEVIRERPELCEEDVRACLACAIEEGDSRGGRGFASP